MTTADFATDDGVMGPRADRPKRRSFTAEFKARVLAEYDAAEREERGAILRREGLYTSHIAEWRKAADAGARAALASSGSARAGRDKRDRELEALRVSAGVVTRREVRQAVLLGDARPVRCFGPASCSVMNGFMTGHA